MAANRRTTKAVMILVVLAISTIFASLCPQTTAGFAVGDDPCSGGDERRTIEWIGRLLLRHLSVGDLGLGSIQLSVFLLVGDFLSLRLATGEPHRL